MSTFGPTIVVAGEVRSVDDVTIEGRLEGPLTCEDAAIIVASTATIVGDIVARDVTIMGRVHGQVIATDVVDVRAGSVVTGDVVAKRFILNDGADFVGRVEPQHLEAALRVARFQQRTRDTSQAGIAQRP